MHFLSEEALVHGAIQFSNKIWKYETRNVMEIRNFLCHLCFHFSLLLPSFPLCKLPPVQNETQDSGVTLNVSKLFYSFRAPFRNCWPLMNSVQNQLRRASYNAYFFDHFQIKPIEIQNRAKSRKKIKLLGDNSNTIMLVSRSNMC